MPAEAYDVKACGRVLALGGRPWLMGVVNATPDSFSDSGERTVSNMATKWQTRLRRNEKPGSKAGFHQIIRKERIKPLLPVRLLQA